ncbi:uncharacterized protein [Nicotiana tomentosiformis]|uniref:uncharacterized protein n=1 Tax=Nicotiana tomentosiformis TaxID=4098 RepID=UPI00388C3809
MIVVQVNAKARNLLYNAISGEEYGKISSCDTTKEIWDKLEVTYEGTSKVKETHINMLVHDYELFQMKEGESIEEMFARFSKIISDLTAFDLITFEKTHLKKTNQEEKKKTSSFKATTERPENDIDDDLEALEEEIAMVSRNIDGLMKRYSGCLTDKDASDDEYKEDTENYFMARGETSEDGFGNPKTILILVELANKDPSKLGYLKKSDNSFLQEHHRKSRKGKWYLDSACSSHMTSDKNLFKKVTKINEGSVKFGDDLRGKIVGTDTVPFNNNCDITEVYLVYGLNDNLLSLS